MLDESPKMNESGFMDENGQMDDFWGQECFFGSNFCQYKKHCLNSLVYVQSGCSGVVFFFLFLFSSLFLVKECISVFEIIKSQMKNNQS